MTLRDRIEQAAARGGTVTFVGSAAVSAVGAVDRVPWQQLHEEARVMAAGLQARGVGPGSHVAVLGPTTRPLVTAIQAVWLAGGAAVVLPLPMRMASFEEFVAQTRRRILNSDAACVVTDADLAPFLAAEAGDPPVVLLDDLAPGPGRPRASVLKRWPSNRAIWPSCSSPAGRRRTPRV